MSPQVNWITSTGRFAVTIPVLTYINVFELNGCQGKPQKKNQLFPNG